MTEDLSYSANPKPINFIVTFDPSVSPRNTNPARFVLLHLQAGRFREIAAGSLEAIAAAERLFSIPTEPKVEYFRNDRYSW